MKGKKDMKKVVLLGDSIREIGYGPRVPALLGEDFEVWQPPENCRFALYTLRMSYDYRPWIEGADVIHWNNGLWDVCQLWEDGPFNSIDDYCDTMVRIARVLKGYAKTVIFATSTPTHPDMPGHDHDRLVAYNEAVVARLQAEGIVINDLFSVIDADIPKYICPDLIHLSEEGIKAAADKVAQCIKEYA